MRRTLWSLLIGAIGSLVGCPSYSPGDVCGIAVCGQGDSGSDAGGPDWPPGCQPELEPKDSLACVDERVAVFVSERGNDATGQGTRQDPVRSLTRAATIARTNQVRLYVCGGEYQEHVLLARPLSIYGGFECGDWRYSGALANVIPNDVGPALSIRGLSSSITIADASFVARDADAPGRSSVAVVVSQSAGVLLLRATILAGQGRDGADAQTPNTTLPISTRGVDAPGDGTGGGPQPECLACPFGATSSGGQGGNGGAFPSQGTSGGPGSAVNSGTSTGATCSAGGKGADVLPAGDGMGAAVLGTATDVGEWQPAAGQKGMAGTTGQGGGGGGGVNGDGNGGGSGGCGGCGGDGGPGGGGGGASVAVLTVRSSVTFKNATLQSKQAGRGGAGAAGQNGAAGGARGSASSSGNGCNGGVGAVGGKGGAGGGGAGGVSAAVLSLEIEPQLDAETRRNASHGAQGAAGTGGNPGHTNDGKMGVSDVVVKL